MLSDSDGPGTKDDRCSADGEAGARVALHALRIFAVGMQAACDFNPVEFGFSVGSVYVCIAAGVVQAAVIADEIVLDQCSYQTGLVDSAEIEATYENTRWIKHLLDEHTHKLDKLLEGQADMIERQTEIIRLLGTANGMYSRYLPDCNDPSDPDCPRR